LLAVASKYRIELSEVEERELRRRAGQYTRSHREVLRAKIVLLAAEGLSNAEIARRLDCTEKSVGKWRRRYCQEGISGLDEKPRPGRPRSFSPRSGSRDQGSGVRASGGVGPAAVALVGS
jgi:DNA-binding CsgD family transcriptional regulator